MLSGCARHGARWRGFGNGVFAYIPCICIYRNSLYVYSYTCTLITVHFYSPAQSSSPKTTNIATNVSYIPRGHEETNQTKKKKPGAPTKRGCCRAKKPTRVKRKRDRKTLKGEAVQRQKLKREIPCVYALVHFVKIIQTSSHCHRHRRLQRPLY